MRTDSTAFAAKNQQAAKEPYIVVELSFTSANDDLLYLTSHADADTPAGEQVIPGVIENVSGTSQTLNQFNFNASIGNMTFSIVDDDQAFSDYLRSKFGSDLTITKKRVRFYLGYPGLAFDDYALIQTQIVEREEVFESQYTIRCYDVQRQQRKSIFEPRETVLAADLDTDTGTITVQSTAGFETYYHGASYSVNPSSTVGHLVIKDGDKIEKATYTGKTSTTFTGVTRGAFGTEALSFTASSSGKSRKVKVIEYIYLEMPAVKLAYAVLTGSLYNDAATLPAHWHLGIDAQYVATSQFTTIGTDWWDTSDDTKGRQLRFEGLKKQDGKAFVETQLYAYLGAFSPILATGELGLKRLASVVSGAGYSKVLDYTNITKASKVTYAHDQVINFIRIDWGYDSDEERYRRSNFFVDPDSRDKFELSDLKTLRFKGLHSAKHSVDALRAMFDGYRDRFAGPPVHVTLEIMPSLNTIEVGDIVLADLTNYPDYFDNSNFVRSMEVQNVAVNWSTGRVTVTLAGSTQRASSLIEYEGDETIPSSSAVPDAKYTDTGTDIESAFSGNVSRSGSVVTVDSDFTLTGHEDLNNSAAVYYVDGDFTLPFGRTLTITENVFLKVKGFFNCFGTIDGAGNGQAGGDHRRYISDITWDRDAYPFNPPASTWDERIDAGYPQQDHSSVWVGHLTEPDSAESIYYASVGNDWKFDFYPKENATGTFVNQVAPFVELDPQTLAGLPGDLRGGGGVAGTALYTLWEESPSDIMNYKSVADGGDGGNGGAGLVILCRGMDFGAGGAVDLSGEDGAEGASFSAWSSVPAYSIGNRGYSFKGSNGSPGMPGCLYVYIDGASASPPTLSSSTVHCNMGDLATAGVEPPFRSGPHQSQNFTNPFGIAQIYYWANEEDFQDGYTYTRFNAYNFLNRAATGNKWSSNALVQFLIEPTDPVDFPEEETDQPLAITLTEYTNTPQTPEGSYSTIDITVTPPSATNYSHSIIEARIQGDTGWQTLGPAQHERSFTTDSDGSTWEFRALAVSTTGVVLDSGPVETITLGDFSTDYATIRPPVTVTGLRLTSQAVGTVFTTPDLQFTWNLNNLSGTGYTESWFSHFKVEIRKADNTLLYTETTKTNIYTLTYSENAALSGGPYNSLQIRVYQVTVDGEEGTPANVTFTNAAPAAPSSFSVQNGSYGSRIQWTNPDDVDFQRVEVYMSETSGFTPSASNRVYNGTGTSVDLSNLSPATTYYYAARSRDTFGNYSSYITEASFTTSAESVDWDNVGDSGGNKPDDNADVTTDVFGGESVLFIDRTKIPENNGEYSTEITGVNPSIAFGSGSNGDLVRAQMGDNWSNGDKAFVKYEEPTYSLAPFDFEKESYFQAAVNVGATSPGDSAAFVGVGEWVSGTGGDIGQAFIGVEFDGAYIYAVCSDGSGNKTRTQIFNGSYSGEDVFVTVHNYGDGNADIRLIIPSVPHDSTTTLSTYVPTSGYSFSNSKNYLMLGVQAYALDNTDNGNAITIDCGYWRFVQKA